MVLAAGIVMLLVGELGTTASPLTPRGYFLKK